MSSKEEANGDNPSVESVNNTKDSALFKPKPKPKIIRVLTVLAYILSVSMAAILLSIYYIFMWDGQPHLGARRGYDMGNDSQPSRVVESLRYGPHQVNVTVVGRVQYYYPTEEDFRDGAIQSQIMSDSTLEENTTSSSTSTTTEENSTWPDYDLSSKFDYDNSIFMKKLMNTKYPVR